MAKVGRPKNPPKAKELLKDVIPVNEMFSKDELPIYENLIDVYLKDFDESELTSSDIDDIMTLATNKIIEIRLLKASRGNAESHLDYSTSLEKLRRHNDKIKDNLAARRKDRVDLTPKGFSIVDLAVAYDDNKKMELERKARKLKREQDKILADIDKYTNKDDVE